MWKHSSILAHELDTINEIFILNRKLGKESRMQEALTIAVGAEGCVEIQNLDGTYPDWLRPATGEEAHAWYELQKKQKYPVSLIDQTGRPYYLVTLLNNAPKRAKYKAAHYFRVKRLLDD
jgi:hypothetical protein